MSGAPTDPFGFTGQYLDSPTALYHMRARQYDPGSGRFTAVDPTGASAAMPHVAAYAYAGQNPVRNTDPSGRCFGPLIFLAPLCIGAVIGVASYVVSVVAVNVVGNMSAGRDPVDNLSRGLNPLDAAISGVAGAAGGPIGGISYGATRILAGAALGCASTFASQAVGGRSSDHLETGIGCVAGAGGSVLRVASTVASFLYGSIVTTAQALTTFVEQQFESGIGTSRK